MNYYEILGLDRGAEQEVIDAAFRAMMRRYHPDIFAGPKAEAESRAKQLNEAYAVLRNPERRRAYDETVGPAAPPPPPIYDTLPNPQSRRAIPRGILAPGVIAVVAALALICLQQPSAPAPVAPVATTEASALPLAPQPTPTPTAEPSPAPTALAGCRGMDCRVMTPFGWGGIEAGVTTDSAQEASGMTIRDDGHYTDAGDGSCLAFEVIGGTKNLQILVEGGDVTTVEASFDLAAPVFMTDREVKLGDPEAAVRKAYKRLKQLPDIYSEPPDKKLFYYEPGGERGIKFSINGGKVPASQSARAASNTWRAASKRAYAVWLVSQRTLPSAVQTRRRSSISCSSRVPASSSSSVRLSVIVPRAWKLTKVIARSTGRRDRLRPWERSCTASCVGHRACETTQGRRVSADEGNTRRAGRLT